MKFTFCPLLLDLFYVSYIVGLFLVSWTELLNVVKSNHFLYGFWVSCNEIAFSHKDYETVHIYFLLPLYVFISRFYIFDLCEIFYGVMNEVFETSLLFFSSNWPVVSTSWIKKSIRFAVECLLIKYSIFLLIYGGFFELWVESH